MRKILSIVLLLAICFGTLTFPAGAHEMGKVGTSTTVSTGRYFTAFIDSNNSLWTCGSGNDGELGNGSLESSKIPIKILDNVISVDCGENFCAAIKTDGSLWMWGNNYWGQLGNGGQGNSSYTYNSLGTCVIQTVPIKVMDNVAAVSCGSTHTAAVKTDGTL